MKKLASTNIILLLVCANLTMLSCTQEEERVIGLEVSGSIADGTYMLDEMHAKGPKYVNKTNSTERIITYNDEGTAMWGVDERQRTIL